VETIDLIHDPLGPLSRKGNQRFRPRARFGIDETVRRLQMTRG